MKYSANGAFDQSILESVLEIGRSFTLCISGQAKSMSTSSKDVEICYSPIILPPEFEDAYQESFEVDASQKMVYLSPLLSFVTFKSGTFSYRCREYARGLVESIEHASPALTAEDRNQFAKVVSSCAETIVEAASRRSVQ